MRQLVAGNWKMNGLGADLAELEGAARRDWPRRRPAMCWSARPPP